MTVVQLIKHIRYFGASIGMKFKYNSRTITITGCYYSDDKPVAYISYKYKSGNNYSIDSIYLPDMENELKNFKKLSKNEQ